MKEYAKAEIPQGPPEGDNPDLSEQDPDEKVPTGEGEDDNSDQGKDD